MNDMELKDIQPIINAEDLVALLQHHQCLMIDVSCGPNAKSNYEKCHIAGAIYVDLNTQLADIKSDAANGGRHPLPDIQQFAATLGKLGITPQTHVVLYDDKNGSNAAARFWWMLKAIGHHTVQVLNGGFSAATPNQLPCDDQLPQITAVENYPCTRWLLPMADMQEVASAATSDNAIVIDVRDAYRYRGENEPIDLIAGHIPGAINIPFTENLDAAGLFLPQEVLHKKYANLFSASNPKVIVHCGSGVTACFTLLAMNYAGYHIPQLYVGSWSEWSRNNQPIGTSIG
jgi:thiosulfate/3-mercaptopyruvate sulfurtransferase